MPPLLIVFVVGMAWGGKKGGEKTYIPAGPGDKPGNDPTPWTYLEKVLLPDC